ncbi:dendritic cell-specific transmembrane protein-like [Sinocyclocheilus grahami]|uniref:dendritic cell-specific transmembrane protein-like n=1 Tax=Sinocyclocheilus grahami TaxID=75366 RepID=UPI0007AC6244|nr:PREDICTED: dendritic cell-specific transmembrane protein-like [Sinocyclocheilus grahami]
MPPARSGPAVTDAHRAEATCCCGHRGGVIEMMMMIRAKLHQLAGGLRRVWSRICGLYTTNTTKSWKEKLLLLLTCFSTSLILSTFFFLILHFSFRCVQEVSLPFTCVFCISLTPAMYFSERIRCFGAVVLISMGMKQAKRLLLTLGTSSVIFFNIQNTLRNMRLLAKGLLCNLEEKLLDINTEPLGNYIKMLKWVGKQLKNYFINFQIVSYHADFTLEAKVDSEDFKIHITEAEQALNQTAQNVLALTNALSSIGNLLSPTLGLLFLVLLTALYLRRFHVDKKYNNIYITKTFRCFDERQREKGNPYILPLTKSESQRYIVTPSIRPTGRRWKAMLKFSLPIFTHCLTWLVFISLDALVYWLIVVLSRRLGELEPLRVPVGIKVQKATLFLGLPVDENVKEANFSYTVSLFEKKCLPEPELWLYQSLVPLTVVLALLLVLILLSSQMVQLRVLLSEQFFSDVAEKRAAYLHEKILRKRCKTKAEEHEGARFLVPLTLP